MRLRQVFVQPFYGALLHANFALEQARYSVTLSAQIGAAARAVSDPQLQLLLEQREWRKFRNKARATGQPNKPRGSEATSPSSCSRANSPTQVRATAWRWG